MRGTSPGIFYSHPKSRQWWTVIMSFDRRLREETLKELCGRRKCHRDLSFEKRIPLGGSQLRREQSFMGWWILEFVVIRHPKRCCVGLCPSIRLWRGEMWISQEPTRPTESKFRRLWSPRLMVSSLKSIAVCLVIEIIWTPASQRGVRINCTDGWCTTFSHDCLSAVQLTLHTILLRLIRVYYACNDVTLRVFSAL
jgi:hypothetical protein